MDINKRTVNAIEHRDDAIKNWNSSETANSKMKDSPEHFTIVFDLGPMLLSAVSSGDYSEAKRLLSLGADVNYPNIDGLTSLHQACIDENFEMVELLIENGANTNVRDNEGWTPLHAAASSTSLDVIQYLVEKGADLSCVNTDGELPIDLAEEDYIKIFLMKQIRLKCIDVDRARNKEHTKMLEDANKWVKNGKIEEIKNIQGASALHVAATKGYMDVMEILLNKLNMDINIKDHDGWTPFHAAVYWKKKESITFLLNNNADYRAKTHVGYEPLDLAEEDIVAFVRNAIRKKGGDLANNATKSEEFSLEESLKRFPHLKVNPTKSSLKKDVVEKVMNEVKKENVIKLPIRPSSKEKIVSSDMKKSILPPPRPKLPKPLLIPKSMESKPTDEGKKESSQDVKLPPKRPPILPTPKSPVASSSSTIIAKPPSVSTPTTKDSSRLVDNSKTEKPKTPPSATSVGIALPKKPPTASVGNTIAKPPTPSNNKKIKPSSSTSTPQAKKDNISEDVSVGFQKKLDDANEVIRDLNFKIALLTKTNEELEKKISDMDPDQSGVNIIRLQKENKRLLQENAALIKAMSAFGRNRVPGQPNVGSPPKDSSNNPNERIKP